MRKSCNAIFITCLLWALAMPAAPVVRAGEYLCRGTVGAITVDDLRVPRKASCTLDGTVVEGTLKVERGATLQARQIVVNGNLQAEGATLVDVRAAAYIGGSIQLKEGGAATIDHLQIIGDLQVEAYKGRVLATRNEVGGNIQILQNRGGVIVADNLVNGNLQCQANQPIPSGGNNEVEGSIEEQCTVLTERADDSFVPYEIVVKLNPASGVTITAINATYGTSTVQTLLSSRGIYLLQTPPTTNALTVLSRMATDSRLVYAEPNFYGELPEGGSRSKWAWAGADPAPTGTQYATTLLGLAAAHTYSQGAQVVVAVLDTGLQLDHPQLLGRLAPTRYDFVDDDAVPDENFPYLDRNRDGIVDESAGHGTHVAALVSLTAPQAQIMPLRVLDANGRGNVFVIAEAISYAAEQGAQIINLSLGSRTQSRVLREVIAAVVAQHDVLIVAAAGNLNSLEPVFPAAHDEVLAVTAVNQSLARADFANYGAWVDVAAPGDEIYSAFPLNSYTYWSGTSMAAPFVAGQAALLESRRPPLTAADLRRCILTTASPLTPALGAGLTNFVASLTAAPLGCPVGDDDSEDGDNHQASPAAVWSTQLYLPLITR